MARKSLSTAIERFIKIGRWPPELFDFARMRNSPFNPFDAADAPAWHSVDAQPGRRIAWLALLLCLPIPLIALRLAYVQTVLQARYLAVWEQTTEETTFVEARDGRILSRDGVVLAFDQPRYDIAVQYRWLEDPPNPDWLRKLALAGLTRQERRDKAKVESALVALRDKREQLWQNLAAASGIDREELARRARSTQQRVERIKASVERRRSERARNSEVRALEISQGLAGIWQTLVDELTTPPNRFANDPLVIIEELHTHTLIEDTPLQVVSAIETYPSQFPGVEVRTGTDRSYPQGRLASHALGLREVRQQDEHDITAGRNGAPVQRVGQTGLEREYDAILQGTPGMVRRLLNRRGEPVSETVEKQAANGADLSLTIDSRLQLIAEKLLDRTLERQGAGLNYGAIDDETSVEAQPMGGVIVVMDVWTGDLLVAADAPGLLQSTLQRPSREEWEEILADPRRPLFPRLTQMSLAPGSVFQMVTAAAALQSGIIGPDEALFCRGFLDSPDGHRCAIYLQSGTGHGEVTLERALGESCNVYFLEIARRLGPEAIVDWAFRFGLGEETGVDLPGESSGQVSAPRTSGAALQLSVGQGVIRATPLQIVRLMASIANGGYLVTPRLRTESTDGLGESGALPAIQRVEGLTPETLAAVKAGLHAGVNGPDGLGRLAQVEGIEVAGKAGTGAVSGDRGDHGWFAGYFPEANPRFAIVVALEHGGAGGMSAAPLARELIEAMGVLGFVTPNFGPLSASDAGQTPPTAAATP